MRLFAQLAPRPRLYRSAARVLRFALRRLARDGWIRRAPGLAAGWTSVRDLKAPAGRTFQDLWRTRREPRS
jgi:L-lactate dehydrogenase complex protein LldF